MKHVIKHVDLLLEQLRLRGLTVEYKDEGTLLLRGPDQEKSELILSAVKKFKPALMERLRPRTLPPELVNCPKLTQVHHAPPPSQDDGPETCIECKARTRPENGRADIGLLCDRKKCPYKPSAR